MKNLNFFLDSGAFSAFTQNVKIDIQDYISFIKQNIDLIDIYSVLDGIGDPEQTLKNQTIMEEQGLKPIPCFHYGENIKYLEHYINNYDYIALGGMVPISTKDLITWLDDIFGNYLCDKKGFVKVKIHGFGMTSFDIMLRYPWYSVDSTTWVNGGKFGLIFVPKIRQDKFDYLIAPIRIMISDNSPYQKKDGMHFDNLSTFEKEKIIEYLQSIGLTIEGVRTRYIDRWKANIIYYQNLGKNLIPYDKKQFLKKQEQGGLFI